MIHGPAIANTTAARDIEIVVFQWSSRDGWCGECGLPAAFFLPRAYCKQGETSEPPTDGNVRCAVCAANAAADGEAVRRIQEEG